MGFLDGLDGRLGGGKEERGGEIGKEREMISLQNEKRRKVQIGLIME